MADMEGPLQLPTVDHRGVMTATSIKHQITMADKTKDRARMVNLLLSWLGKFATSVKEVVCLAKPKCRASLHTEPRFAHVVAQKDSQVFILYLTG